MHKSSKDLSEYLSSLLKYLGAALFIFIPLYPKFPLFFLSNSTVAIRAEDFLLALSGLVLFFIWFIKKTKLLKLPLFIQIFVYIFVGLLSIVSAIFITQTVLPGIAIFHWVRRIEYLLGFFIIYQAVRENHKNAFFYTQVIIVSSLGVFLYAIAQIYMAAPVISTMNSEFSKGIALTLEAGVPISSTFGGHYDLAVYLVFVLCVLSGLFVRQERKLVKASLALLFIGLLWLLFQTGARFAALSGLIAIPTVLIFAHKIKLIPIFLALFILGAFSSPNLISRFGNILEVIKARFDQTSFSLINSVYAATDELTSVNQEVRPIQIDRSTSIRFDVEWPRALRSFYKNPFLGTGYSSISLATDNDYLRLLGETGILGFLAFVSILIAIVKHSLTKFAANPEYAGILVTMLLGAIFLDVFEASKIAILFWMLSGLALGQKNIK